MINTSQSPAEPPVKFLIWNTKRPYELQARQVVLDSIGESSCEVAMVSTLDPLFKSYTLKLLAQGIVERAALGTCPFVPDAMVRREEHGVLWSGAPWQDFMATCRAANPAMRSLCYDFGYLNHYKTLMVDIQDTSGRSSIALDWPKLPETVDWSSVRPYIATYRSEFLRLLELAKNTPAIDGLPSGNYVVIWPQQYMDLLRLDLRERVNRNIDTQVSDWVLLCCEAVRRLGLVPVVKLSPNLPSWKRFDLARVKAAARVYVTNKNHADSFSGCKTQPNINSKLIAHAAFHIVSCSTVTNELTLAEAPVVAMGRSWFTGLGIFQEPASWETLLDNPTEINHSNRHKWINWWLQRQVPQAEIGRKLVQIYRDYRDRL